MDTFLRGDALSRLLVHSIRNAASYVTDPITDTVCTMINTPVAAVFGVNGLMPLQHTSSIVFPYAYMTAEQRAYISERLLTGDATAGVVSLASRSSCVEVIFAHRTKAGTFISAGEILFCMCEGIIGTRPADGDTERLQRLNVCNVLLQRIRCSVHVAHDVVVGLQARLRVLFPVGGAEFLQKARVVAVGSDAASVGEAQEPSCATDTCPIGGVQPADPDRHASTRRKRPRDAVAPLGVGV